MGTDWSSVANLYTMISLVRKANPITDLKNGDLAIFLPQIDFINWLAWSDDRRGDLIMAKITGIHNGESAVAVVGCADSEVNEYGNIYISQYLINKLNLTDTILVRIEPYLEEIPKGVSMTVMHDCELANELGLDIFSRLQETIMDWPIISKDVPVRLLFPEAGDLIVEMIVTKVEPDNAFGVRLGGEIGLEIEYSGEVIRAPTVAAAAAAAAVEPDPATIYKPRDAWTNAGKGYVLNSEERPVAELTPEEMRQHIRNSRLAHYTTR